MDTKMAKTTTTKEIRFNENPYINDLVVPLTNKRVQVTPLGKENNVALINTETGDLQGTHVTTFRKVDADQFVKLFIANIGLTFNLKSCGIKAFNVLMWTIRQGSPNRDLFALDKYALECFLDSQGEDLKCSQSTFSRGLVDLEKSKIIAKNVRKGWYYINPNFAFSGDRIAFTTIIEREKEKINPQVSG